MEKFQLLTLFSRLIILLDSLIHPWPCFSSHTCPPFAHPIMLRTCHSLINGLSHQVIWWHLSGISNCALLPRHNISDHYLFRVLSPLLTNTLSWSIWPQLIFSFCLVPPEGSLLGRMNWIRPSPHSLLHQLTPKPNSFAQGSAYKWHRPMPTSSTDPTIPQQRCPFSHQLYPSCSRFPAQLQPHSYMSQQWQQPQKPV